MQDYQGLLDAPDGREGNAARMVSFCRRSATEAGFSPLCLFRILRRLEPRLSWKSMRGPRLESIEFPPIGVDSHAWIDGYTDRVR
jgi:hypothetical protein